MATTPNEIVEKATAAGEKKATMPIKQMVLRGAGSGALLGIATSLAMTVWVQPFGKELPMLGAVVFPVGFVMLVLLGLELITGNFALYPMAIYAGKATWKDAGKATCFVTLGNLLGSLIYAILFWASYSNLGDSLTAPIGVKAAAIAVKKTVAYEELGARGWFVAVFKAIGCNWMVTVGVMMNFTATATAGRIAAMWLPIMIFFAHGYEHAVVNFFVIPAGIMFGADVTFWQWLFWNQIPVLIGNFIGGALFTGLPLAYAFPAGRPPSGIGYPLAPAALQHKNAWNGSPPSASTEVPTTATTTTASPSDGPSKCLELGQPPAVGLGREDVDDTITDLTVTTLGNF